MPEYLRIPKKEWLAMQNWQVDEFVEAVFTHYKEKGFPYFPTSKTFRANEYNKMKRFNYHSVVEGDVIRQTMHGLSLAWSYMPHSWSVACNDKLTPLDVFNDDDKDP